MAGTEQQNPWGALSDIPRPDDRLGSSHALPIHRPLAVDYQLPYRGTEGHGIDNDIPTDDFEETDRTPIDPPEPSHDAPYIREVIAPDPVPVTIVDKAFRTEIRDHNSILVFNGQETYAATSGVDLTTVVQVLGLDHTRTKATFYLTTSVPVAGKGATQGVLYMVASRADMRDGVILDQFNTNSVVFEGKNAVFAALVATSAYQTAAYTSRSLACVTLNQTLVEATP